tara:strand:+ start:1639 stop:2556 length:918 start_codon:yes stop_codon:yes gene_type:complete
MNTGELEGLIKHNQEHFDYLMDVNKAIFTGSTDRDNLVPLDKEEPYSIEEGKYPIFTDSVDKFVFKIITAMMNGYDPERAPPEVMLKSLGEEDYNEYLDDMIIQDIKGDIYPGYDVSIINPETNYLNIDREPKDHIGDMLAKEFSMRSFEKPLEKGLISMYFEGDFNRSIKFSHDYFDRLSMMDPESDEVKECFEYASNLLKRAEKDLDRVKRMVPVIYKNEDEDVEYKGLEEWERGIYEPLFADLRELQGRYDQFKEVGPRLEEAKDMMAEMGKSIIEERYEDSASYLDKVEALTNSHVFKDLI